MFLFVIFTFHTMCLRRQVFKHVHNFQDRELQVIFGTRGGCVDLWYVPILSHRATDLQLRRLEYFLLKDNVCILGNVFYEHCKQICINLLSD